ncbi:MAG TPA: phosphomannomutase [Myxococcota bacterium]|nr:phosphomannomutase [Myxococcota bacterium]HRY97186.1 phosphomannomutase [Myxococcota bacterium]HSA21777.1 phosphomannomutase [Myxococcota bacterium]
MPEGQVLLGALAAESGVQFGTSGARGPVAALTDRLCFAYADAFLQLVGGEGESGLAQVLGLGMDLRPSSPRIAAALVSAANARGLRPVFLGALPSPALALWGLEHGAPTAMVTGSHIPADRNGIKFTRRGGEISKADEADMLALQVALPVGWFDAAGALVAHATLPDPDPAGLERYAARYLGFFPADALRGLKVGLWQHSAVGRDLLARVLAALGAEVVPLGRAEGFVAVDTEAVSPEDEARFHAWCAEHRLDALVSTDGDSDRPLVCDERGRFLRGDLAGVLLAGFLGARAVVTPVSSNSALERSGRFARVVRTRIGSPYVIEGMRRVAEGAGPVVGYEANGGFLLQTPVERQGRTLAPLPTRDALIVILGLLTAARERGLPLSALVGELPARFGHAARLQAFPVERSTARLRDLLGGDEARARAALEAEFGPRFGRLLAWDALDGLRMTFDARALGGGAEDVVHVRPSGNAPELRCYTEADSDARARELAAQGSALLEGWR